MRSAIEIAQSLGGKRSGGGWIARCPAHEDRSPSLSVSELNGKVLVRCHAGCSQASVIEALKDRGLWGEVQKRNEPKVEIDLKPASSQPKKIVAEYPYTNENGQVLYIVERYEPKDFRPKTPDGKRSLSGVRRVPYRLPNVLRAIKEGVPVYICEGEKDVHTAESLGLVATCCSGGANGWKDEFAGFFHGARVVVVPDQDEPGAKYAKSVSDSIKSKALSIKICNPKVGKDLTDWVQAGATVQDIEGATQGIDQSDKKSRFTRIVGGRESIKPIRWIVRDCFEDNALTEIFGPPGGGKSFVAVSLACSVATGADWFGHKVSKGAVFYIAGEGHSGLHQRFVAWSEDNGVSLDSGHIFKSDYAISVFDEDSAKSITSEVQAITQETGVKPRLVIIDTLARAFGDGNENETSDMNKFISNLDNYIRIPFECTVLIVHHSGHTVGRARGSSVLKAAVEAEFEVDSKPDTPVITLRNHKQKNGPLASEKLFRLVSHDLGEVEGERVYSAVLKSADEADLLSKTYGEYKISIKDILESFTVSDLSVNQAKQSVGLSHGTMTDAVNECVRHGFLVQQSNKKYSLTEKGKNVLTTRGGLLRVQDKLYD